MPKGFEFMLSKMYYYGRLIKQMEDANGTNIVTS